jgi:hypothetical protein
VLIFRFVRDSGRNDGFRGGDNPAIERGVAVAGAEHTVKSLVIARPERCVVEALSNRFAIANAGHSRGFTGGVDGLNGGDPSSRFNYA